MADELKQFKLNNSILDDFDKLMSQHLDCVEDLEINEPITNSKIYNIISLCSSVKTLRIKGDMRIDTNKICFNICKPEKLETIVLENVKLPSSKMFTKFNNLQTISLTNITFSNVYGFLNDIANKDCISAINLTNIDFGKKAISVLKKFPNLKYINLNGLKNCNFDSFEFIDDEKVSRLEFKNNIINLRHIPVLMSGKYQKNLNLGLEGNFKNRIVSEGKNTNIKIYTSILNRFIELTDNHPSLSFKIINLVFDSDIDYKKIVPKLQLLKSHITVNMGDLSNIDIESARILKNYLNVKKIDNFTVDEYIEIRRKFDEIVDLNTYKTDELSKFLGIYEYFKSEFQFVNDVNDIKSVFEYKLCSYNYYAIAMASVLKSSGLATNVISGAIDGENGYMWIQVRINGNWYNSDVAYEVKPNSGKKLLNSFTYNCLMDDESFSKTHVSLSGNEEICRTQYKDLVKELRQEEKENVGFLKYITNRIASIFKNNKHKALPEPKKGDV